MRFKGELLSCVILLLCLCAQVASHEARDAETVPFKEAIGVWPHLIIFSEEKKAFIFAALDLANALQSFQAAGSEAVDVLPCAGTARLPHDLLHGTMHIYLPR